MGPLPLAPVLLTVPIFASWVSNVPGETEFLDVVLAVEGSLRRTDNSQRKLQLVTIDRCLLNV